MRGLTTNNTSVGARNTLAYGVTGATAGLSAMYTIPAMGRKRVATLTKSAGSPGSTTAGKMMAVHSTATNPQTRGSMSTELRGVSLGLAVWAWCDSMRVLW